MLGIQEEIAGPILSYLAALTEPECVAAHSQHTRCSMIGERIHFLGLPLNVGLTVADICNLLRQKSEGYTCSKINPGVWAVAERNPEYVDILENMSYVLADGEGVAAACRFLTGKPCQRMSFDMTSLADPFFKMAVESNSSIILVGAKPHVCDDVKDKLQLRYPSLNIIDTMHGFGDFEPKISTIIEKAPDAVIVGMGVPRQEMFVNGLRLAGYKGFALTCGGFFDQYLLADDYYPAWIDKWNLRFLYRIYKEPRRLWRRYFIDYQCFIGKFLKAYGRKLIGKGVSA